MATINTTTTQISVLGGTAPFAYSIVNSTISSTVSGLGVLSIDATGVAPGTYFVRVQVTDAQSVTYQQNVSVLVTEQGVLAIKDSSFTIPLDTFPSTVTKTLTPVGGTSPYTWTLVSSPVAGTTLSPTGTLAVPFTQYGTFPIGVKVTDSSNNVVTQTLSFLVIPSKSFKIVDGQVEIDLASTNALVAGQRNFTVSVTDSASSTVSQVFYFQALNPLSTYNMPDAHLRLLTASDIGNFSFVPGGNPSAYFNIPPQSFGPVLGMAGTISSTGTATLAGPPTKFGSQTYPVDTQWTKGNSGVNVFHKDIQVSAVQSLSNWGSCTINLPTMVLNQKVEFNPLKPYQDSADWYKNNLYVRLAKVPGSSAYYTLPTGMSLDKVTGILYGIPSSSNVSVSVLEYFDTTGSVVGTVTLNWDLVQSQFTLALSGSNPLQVSLGTQVNTHLSSSISLSSISVHSGELPTGLSLAVATGGATLSGTATCTGYFNCWIKAVATDASVAYLNLRTYATYQDPLVILTSNLPKCQTNVPYYVVLAGFGGSNLGYTWATTTALPTGITLTPDGVLAGTPTDTTYSQSLAITLTDSQGLTATTHLTLTLANQIQILTSALPVVKSNQAYNYQLSAVGGIATLTWQAYVTTPGDLATAAQGFACSSAGVLSRSATPAITAMNLTLVLSVTDGTSTATKNLPLVLNNGFTDVPLTAQVSPVKRGCAYQATVTIGTNAVVVAPFTWTIDASPSNPLPTGLSFSVPSSNSTSCSIIGNTIQTWAGTKNFTVTLVDSAGSTGHTTLSLTSVPSMVANSPTVAFSGRVGNPVATTGAGTMTSQLQGAFTTCNPPLSFVAVGSCPGLVMSPSGVISGTPTTAGTFSVSFTATDLAGDSASVTGSFTVDNSTLAITTASLPNPTPFVAYSAPTMAASGGTPPYTWSLGLNSDPLFTGLVLNPNGNITGTPTSQGTANLAIKVTDAAGVTATKNFTVTCSSSISASSIVDPSNTYGGLLGMFYSTANLPATTQPFSNSYPLSFQITGLSKAPLALITTNNPAITFKLMSSTPTSGVYTAVVATGNDPFWGTNVAGTSTVSGMKMLPVSVNYNNSPDILNMNWNIGILQTRTGSLALTDAAGHALTAPGNS